MDSAGASSASASASASGSGSGSPSSVSAASSPAKKKGALGRLSALGAKKKVASKIGESKLGRSTLIRLMGPEGDAVVSALKAAVTKYESRVRAKELKKDVMKWVLKASVLMQHKDLTRDNTAHLRRPLQASMEKMLAVCDGNEPGTRDMGGVSRDLYALGDQLKALLEPHCRDKNAVKVDKIVAYYASPAFLGHLMNKAEFSEERGIILESTRVLLLPLPRLLSHEEQLQTALHRARSIELETAPVPLPPPQLSPAAASSAAASTAAAGGSPRRPSPRLRLCFDKNHPEVGNLFAHHLDACADKALGAALRFLMAEVEFSHISAAGLRASRARVLFNKYLRAPVEGRPLCSDAAALAALQDAIDDGPGAVGKSAFAEVRRALLADLEQPFAAFVETDAAFLERTKGLKEELLALHAQFAQGELQEAMDLFTKQLQMDHEAAEAAVGDLDSGAIDIGASAVVSGANAATSMPASAPAPAPAPASLAATPLSH